MAVLTFAQRVQLMENRGQNEITDANNTNTSPLSRIRAALFKVVADILTSDLTITTPIDNGTFTTLQSRGVTLNQLKMFARSIRDSKRYEEAFIYGLLDEPGYMSADTDNKLKNSIQKTIWFYAIDL